jgi:hypothetical protein
MDVIAHTVRGVELGEGLDIIATIHPIYQTISQSRKIKFLINLDK